MLEVLVCAFAPFIPQIPAMLPSGYMGSTLENDSYPTSEEEGEEEEEDEEEEEEEDLEEEEGSGVCVMPRVVVLCRYAQPMMPVHVHVGLLLGNKL